MVEDSKMLGSFDANDGIRVFLVVCCFAHEKLVGGGVGKQFSRLNFSPISPIYLRYISDAVFYCEW
jgi:hypothetical protein